MRALKLTRPFLSSQTILATAKRKTCYGSAPLGQIATNPDFVAYLRTQRTRRKMSPKRWRYPVYTQRQISLAFTAQKVQTCIAGGTCRRVGSPKAMFWLGCASCSITWRRARQQQNSKMPCSWTRKWTTPSTKRPTTPLHVPGCPCMATDSTLHKREHARSWAACGAHCLAGR